MKVREFLEEISKYPEDADIRVFIKCKNTSVGIDQILRYNQDAMIYLDSDDEKNIMNIAP